jgi:hypothetical protein
VTQDLLARGAFQAVALQDSYLLSISLNVSRAAYFTQGSCRGFPINAEMLREFLVGKAAHAILRFLTPRLIFFDAALF